jgi:hypothetical protein
MISFGLWFDNFHIQWNKKFVEAYRNFFLRLRFVSIAISGKDFEHAEIALGKFFKIELSDVLGSDSLPIMNQLKMAPFRITSEYLETLKPWKFPYLVHFSAGFNFSTRVYLIAARLFPRISIDPEGLKHEDMKKWELIVENIEHLGIFSDFKSDLEQVVLLPNCKKLTMQENIEVAAPLLKELNLMKRLDFSEPQSQFVLTENLSFLMNLPRFPLLRKLTINFSGRMSELPAVLLSNSGIEELNLTETKLDGQDLSKMTSLRELKISHSDFLANTQDFPLKLPSGLKELAVNFSFLRRAVRNRCKIPAIATLRIDSSNFDWYVQATPEFPEVEFLQVEGLGDSKFFVQEGLNPWVILENAYIPQYIFSPSTGEVFKTKEPLLNVLELKKFSVSSGRYENFPYVSNMSFPEVRHIELTAFETDPGSKSENLAEDLAEVERLLFSDPVDIEGKIQPRAETLIIRERSKYEETEIYDIVKTIQRCPALQEIFVISWRYQDLQKIVEYTLNLLSMQTEVIAASNNLIL